MDDLAKAPGLGMHPFAACPDICPSHEAIKQTNPDLRNIAARKIDTYSQEARSPRLPVLLAPSLASDSGRLEHGNVSNAHQPHFARTPVSPTLGSVIGQFNFHMTASLLGKTATDFCRQLERPGDVICEGNRSISAAQAPSTSAHPFARSLSFTCHANLRCGHFLLQVVCLDQQQ